MAKPELEQRALERARAERVRIVKLEIFEDCEVAIRVETGQW